MAWIGTKLTRMEHKSSISKVGKKDSFSSETENEIVSQ